MSDDSVPLNISVASAKNRFCLKRLGTTTDFFRIGFMEDIDFRTAELDGIVCKYFQILENNFSNSIIVSI